MRSPTRVLALLMLTVAIGRGARAVAVDNPAPGTEPGAPLSGVAARTGAPAESPTETSGDKTVALAEWLSAWWAFPIGLLGSGAYLVAVWVGMVGRGGDTRDRILAFFSPWSLLKVPLYLASGGGVALVFQLPEKKLVPIQAFIIGCTWPSVVANYLSGRQTGVPEQAEKEAESVREKSAELQRLKSLQDALPEPHLPADAEQDELKTLLETLKGHDG